MNPTQDTMTNVHEESMIMQTDQMQDNRETIEEASNEDSGQNAEDEFGHDGHDSPMADFGVVRSLLDDHIPKSILNCIHDLSQPTCALQNMRLIAGDHGVIFVIDAYEEDHVDDGDNLCAHPKASGSGLIGAGPADSPDIMYGFSCTCCLLGDQSCGRRHPCVSSDSTKTDSMHTTANSSSGASSDCNSTLREYADRIGFRDIEILPVHHPFLRFYKLYG